MIRLIVGIIVLLLSTSGYGQSLQKIAAPSDSLKAPFQFIAPVVSGARLRFIDQRQQPVKQNMAPQHLPFFCEGERVMDKKLPMPLRLRLGSLQQVDWLESKPSAVRPQP